MIDLHIHTNNSDGLFTVEEILKEAQRKALEFISITDHNTIEAYNQIKKLDLSSIYSGNIVVGIEVNCVFEGLRIELLGYDFSNSNLLNNWLELHFPSEKEIAFRTKEYDKLLRKMEENNAKYSCPAIYDPNGKLPHTVIYNELKAHEQNRRFLSADEWENFSTFFRTATIDKNSPFFINYSDILPSAKDVSSVIRESGGKVFLAHVFSYHMTNHMSFIDNLVQNKVLDGIETYYLTFTEEQSKQLYVYCQENSLLMSGGSDFHDHDGKIELGTGFGRLNVPVEILNDWHLPNHT